MDFLENKNLIETYQNDYLEFQRKQREPEKLKNTLFRLLPTLRRNRGGRSPHRQTAICAQAPIAVLNYAHARLIARVTFNLFLFRVDFQHFIRYIQLPQPVPRSIWLVGAVEAGAAAADLQVVFGGKPPDLASCWQGCRCCEGFDAHEADLFQFRYESIQTIIAHVIEDRMCYSTGNSSAPRISSTA